MEVFVEISKLLKRLNYLRLKYGQECPSVRPNRGVDLEPTGFFRFRIEFGLRFV